MAKRGRKPKSESATAVSEQPRGAKSAAVRDYLTAHKNAMPKEVVAALKEQNIIVSPNMVSILKAKMKVRGAKRQARSEAASGGGSTGNAAGLDAALTLYKAAAANGKSGKVRQAFLTLVELLG